MVPNDTSPRDIDGLSTVLLAACDRARIRILFSVRHESMTAGAIVKVVGYSRPAISHHLAVLRANKLIRFEKIGRFRHYSATDHGRSLVDSIAAFGQ